MTSRGRAIILAVVVTSSFSTGCATFRGGLVTPVDNWPPTAPEVRKSISVTVRMERHLDLGPSSGPAPVSEDELNQMRGRVWAQYEDSGLFSDVKTGLESSDLRADVRIDHHEWGSAAGAVLSGLTLMLVPIKVQVDDYTMTTTFKNGDGQVLGVIEKKEKLDTWFQLFLVVVAPFKFVLSQANAATTDLVRSTIEEAHGRRII